MPSHPAVRLQRSCYTGTIGIILGRTHTSPGLLQNKSFFFFACTKARRKCSHCDTWFQVPQFHLEHKKHTKISRETMPGMRVPSKGGRAGLGNLLVTKKKKQSGEIFPTTLVHQNLLVTKQSRKIFPTTTLHQRNPQIASGGKKKKKKKSHVKSF